MLFDTHCHPYLAKEKSQDEILENFFSSEGKYLNTIGVDIESSELCIKLSQKYPWVLASIGIHPTHCLDYKGSIDAVITHLEELYRENKQHVIAIGETGLDYYWLDSLSEKYKIPQEEIMSLQKKFFIAQIQLAKKQGLPLIIHNRNSAEDIFDILTQEDCKNFVFHCYSENLSYAQKLLRFAPDCKLGFGWVTTFKNAQNIQETVKHIPLKNILIETDSPYLTPSPYRGKQENEPLFCRYILSQIIDLRAEPAEEITKNIFENSCEFFGINR